MTAVTWVLMAYVMPAKKGGFTLTGKLVLAVACVCLLVACGHTSLSSSTSVASSIAPQSTSAAPTTPAVTVGCGTYCQQAGASAGTNPPGYPCPAAGCRQCPPQNCVTLESGGATATNGIITVKLRCNLSTACRGAFLLCLPSFTCWGGPTSHGAGGRLAGSDFVVPPGATREVGVALTTLAGRVVSNQQPFSAGVLVDLLDYGNVLVPSRGFSLASTDPPAYPAGATSRCGPSIAGALFVGPDTSCPFAKNVAKAWLRSGGPTVRAFSPVTGRTYLMHCTSGTPHVCRGGINALVVFYY